SRRRHTRFSRDWSSDVCSSDLYFWLTSPITNHHLLLARLLASARIVTEVPKGWWFGASVCSDYSLLLAYSLFLSRASIISSLTRSEERRVGKECISRWRP